MRKKIQNVETESSGLYYYRPELIYGLAVTLLSFETIKIITDNSPGYLVFIFLFSGAAAFYSIARWPQTHSKVKMNFRPDHRHLYTLFLGGVSIWSIIKLYEGQGLIYLVNYLLIGSFFFFLFFLQYYFSIIPKWKTWREQIYFKPVIISLAWVYAVNIIPVFFVANSNIIFLFSDKSVLWFCNLAINFVLVFVLALYFDMINSRDDLNLGFRTWANTWTLKKFYFRVILPSVGVFFLFAQAYLYTKGLGLMSFVLVCLYAFILISLKSFILKKMPDVCKFLLIDVMLLVKYFVFNI